MSKAKSTNRQCLGCSRMAGEERTMIDGTKIIICPECARDKWAVARALNKARGEAVGIQRGGS